MATVGAGEAAALVAEQLAGQQLFRNGPAVDRHEAAATTGHTVDGARHQILAGAGFAGHQDIQIGRRYAHDVLAQHDDAVAVANDAQVALLRFAQSPEHPLQALGRERLGQEFAAPELLCAALGFARVIARDHDDLWGMVRVEPFDQIETAAVRQANIHHQQVGKVAVQPAAGFAKGVDALGTEAAIGGEFNHLIAELHVVVDDGAGKTVHERFCPQ